ncbi:MAG TPA: tRNA lysidine(34) synthetase TilS [Gemmatimonadales bacterium]|nr:tRNA lysidine(34) synthetase TilS [Gemmatimonadales bacterium]
MRTALVSILYFGMSALLDRFRDHVTGRRLFPVPGKAVVAVSGGPDSVALLDLLDELADDLGVPLIVAHADHGIQAESAAVGQAVAALARRFGRPFELGALGLGPEASETAARRARYAWFQDIKARHQARYLVTAHHRDDQVETILLRLLRGSAPAGLAGMPARGRGGLVRPLLPFTRDELAAHAAARALPVHQDPANRDPRHLRSWVRTTLLPVIETRLGAQARDDIVRAGRAAALERRAWDRALTELPALDLRLDTHGFHVARAELERYDDALAVAVVRAAARRTGLVLGLRRARQVIGLLGRPSGRHLSLGGGWEAEVAFDRLRVGRTTGCAAEAVVATAENGSALFGAYQVQWAPDAAPTRFGRADWTTWIALGDWEVRTARPGDRLVPLGGAGHRPVRRLLMEARVPRGDRATYPVVARGETILWVPGICRSAAELPRPGTPAVRVDVTKRDGLKADGRA